MKTNRFTGKQVRNQWEAAGITAREANQLHSMMRKLVKIYQKPNLYVGYQDTIGRILVELEDLLEESGRS